MATLAGVSLVALVGVSPAAAASSGAQVLAVGKEVSLTQPGVVLHRPTDGRLGGYTFLGAVTGVTFSDHAGAGGQAVTAPPHATLVVVSAGFDSTDDPSQSYKTADGADASPTTALVTTGGQQIAPPLAESQGNWAGTWAVAVPDGAPAALAVSEVGFTQSLDLRTGKRISPAPAVMYRSVSGPDVIIQPAATTALTATVAGTSQSVQVPVTVDTAALSYFADDSTTTAPGPDQAFLIVDTSSTDPDDGNGGDIEASTSLPASALTLEVPGQPPLHPVSGGGSTAAAFLDDTYTFVVPGDITTAQLQVAPGGNVPADDPSDNGDTSVTLDFPTPATLSLDFPPIVHYTAPGTAPASRASVTRSRSGGALIQVLTYLPAALFLLVLASAALFVLSRRWWLIAGPVRRSQRALLAGTTGLLPPAPPTWGPPALNPAPAMLGPAPTPPSEQPADGPHQPAGPVLVLRVLGRPGVDGLTGTIRRRALIRLLLALAIAGRPITVEELRDVMATKPGQAPSITTIHSLASKLRTGHLPAGVLPPIGAGDTGYRLDGDVEVDWQLFQALTAEADGATEDTVRLDRLSRALQLVSGPPLDHGSWEGISAWLRAMETAIEQAATDAARLALTLRDPRAAAWAVNQGLLAVPGSPACWDLRLTAAAGGSGEGLERAWQLCRQALGADADMLTTTYERLRSGAF